jgi:hypothetical protein
MSRSLQWKIWTVPGVLVVLTMTGLLSALLSEEIAWKALAWAFIAVPVLAALWFACVRPLLNRTRH